MTWHAFSFGPFYDPARVGFGPLVLCDEHLLAEGKGFDTHAHSGVTIATIPLSGCVTHRDSSGLESDLTTYDGIGIFETAGGVTHSEYASAPQTRFLQMWFVSEAAEPSYVVHGGRPSVGGGELQVVRLESGDTYDLPIAERRYVHVGTGALLRNSLAEPLSQGDAYLIEGAEPLSVTAATRTQLVVWTGLTNG